MVQFMLERQCQFPRDNYDLAVISKVDGKLIGIGHITITRSAHREGEIGFILRKDHWGKGLGTAIAKLLIDICLGQLSLCRVNASCHSKNIASNNVLKKAGMALEKITYKDKFVKNLWIDSYYYTIKNNK